MNKSDPIVFKKLLIGLKAIQLIINITSASPLAIQYHSKNYEFLRNNIDPNPIFGFLFQRFLCYY